MLADAKKDIDRLYRDAIARRRRKARIRGVVHAIDDLLFELEELNLEGVDRVPSRLRERAGQLLELVPDPEDPDFRVRHRVVPMMDVLFRALSRITAPLDLLVVGEGDLRTSYERRASEAALAGRVHFLGRVEDADLIER